ncbi:MAG: hypothetical protein WAS26_00530 [Paracoccaceae bacterium]
MNRLAPFSIAAAVALGLPTPSPAQDAAADAAAIRALSLYTTAPGQPFSDLPSYGADLAVTHVIEIDGCMLHIREISAFRQGDVETLHQTIDLRDVAVIFPDTAPDPDDLDPLTDLHLIPKAGPGVPTLRNLPEQMSFDEAFLSQPLDGFSLYRYRAQSAKYVAPPSHSLEDRSRAWRLGAAVKAYAAAHCPD